MKKAIITVGVSASGKSTWAKKYVQEHSREWNVVLNRDRLRHIVHREQCSRDFSWDTWKMKWEKIVTKLWNVDFECATFNAKYYDGDYTIICSDTNLNPGRRKALARRLDDAGFAVEYKYFPISYEEAVKRDLRRGGWAVGSSVIAKQMEQWNADQEIPDLSSEKDFYPYAVIVDIDGTLAHMKGRKPFDWDRVGEDEVDEEVRSVMVSMSATNHKIIVFSGRDSVCRPQTEQWIRENLIPCDLLVMRKEGDMRPDEVVKKELLMEHVAGKYHILAVIDDRPKVCRMWRSLGLKVFQVGNPHIEF